MSPKLSDLSSIGAILAVWSLAAYLYPSLPDPMPVHWNLDGEVDGYSTRLWGIAVLCLLPLGVFLLLRVLPSISPQGFRMDRFERALDMIVLAITLAISGLVALALLAAAGGDVPTGTLRPLILGGLFVVIGNFLGKVQRNFFVGIRTPWTLASDEVWARTHRVGAWLFVLAGVAICATALEPRWFLRVLVAAIGGAAILSVAYSFVVYRRLHGFH